MLKPRMALCVIKDVIRLKWGARLFQEEHCRRTGRLQGRGEHVVERASAAGLPCCGVGPAKRSPQLLERLDLAVAMDYAEDMFPDEINSRPLCQDCLGVASPPKMNDVIFEDCDGA